MKLIVPKYYKDFVCKGGCCSDNCCIGWEIDIDNESLERYNSEGGEFGNRLRAGITDEGGSPHFKLCGDRCPHLNSDNLCDLIIEKGQDYLCEICREHPRFYTTLGDVIYGGVGMSCEAAAELILSTSAPTEYITAKSEGEECECDRELYDIMMEARSFAADREAEGAVNPDGWLRGMMHAAVIYQSRMNGDGRGCEFDDGIFCDIPAIFEEMEFMSGELMELMRRPHVISCDQRIEEYLFSIHDYLYHRYIPKAAEDGFILGKMFIVASSVLALKNIFCSEETLTFERAVYIAKLFSKEVEYNENNISLLEEKAERNLRYL